MPEYEYHLSSDPDLLKKGVVHGDAGGLVYTTKTPHLWESQLNYERIKNPVKYLYVVEVKNPVDMMTGSTAYGHETVSPASEVRVVGKIGDLDEMFGDKPLSIGRVEHEKEKILKNITTKSLYEGIPEAGKITKEAVKDVSKLGKIGKIGLKALPFVGTAVGAAFSEPVQAAQMMYEYTEPQRQMARENDIARSVASKPQTISAPRESNLDFLLNLLGVDNRMKSILMSR